MESLLKNPWVEEGTKKGKEIGLQEGLQQGEFKAKTETAKK